MKTKGMKHQIIALRKLSDRTAYALLMEQGTGKTWTLLADAERLYAAGTIDAVLVLAPNGVHTNWIKREIPAHLSVAAVARAWHSGMGIRDRARVEDILRPREHFEVPPLRILAMSYDAANTKEGFAFADRFLKVTKALIIADESSRIKNPSSLRTKQALRLRQHCVAARIATGTPISKAPPDVFSQFEFLSPGLLGTSSYRAFVAEYADLLPLDDPMMKVMISRNPKAAFAQIVAKNPDGTPKWRNLDKLRSMIEPNAFRVLKKDCLDLPEKVYENVYFRMNAKQRAAYRLMEDECRIELTDGSNASVKALNAINKLQQITSGFLIVPKPVAVRTKEPMLTLEEAGPRIAALLECVESLEGQFIVWAKFTEELRQINIALNEAGITTVQYTGSVNRRDREKAVDAFQAGEARGFVGQPQSGGIGLTLTAATTVIYYSNDYNLETRLQSEDRAHRIGTTGSVLYIDIVAEGTIDERVAENLQRKKFLAQTILGD